VQLFRENDHCKATTAHSPDAQPQQQTLPQHVIDDALIITQLRPTVSGKPHCSSRKTDESVFLSVALSTLTDKVTTHCYDDFYSPYLDPIRHKQLKFLEIGLGCDMNYAAGESFRTWNAYFSHPQSLLHFLEYDAVCVDKFREKIKGELNARVLARSTLHAGDQSDMVRLQKLVETVGSLDVVIDDGGHSCVQQRNSFQILFAALNPGGIYFLEDMQTSYSTTWGTNPQSMANRTTTVDLMHDILKVFNQGVWEPELEPFRKVVETLESVNCYREACVLIKKGPPLIKRE